MHMIIMDPRNSGMPVVLIWGRYKLKRRPKRETNQPPRLSFCKNLCPPVAPMEFIETLERRYFFLLFLRGLGPLPDLPALRDIFGASGAQTNRSSSKGGHRGQEQGGKGGWGAGKSNESNQIKSNQVTLRQGTMR